MKSSRQALIGYFADADWKQRRELAEAIVEGFKAAVAAGAAGQEGERVVTGWLGMLAGVVDAGVIGVRVLCGDAGGEEEEAKALKQLRSLFIATQKAHYKSGSIPKLEAAVCIYGSLAVDLLPPPPSASSSNPPPAASRQPLLKEVLKKLASLMLHPYLRIRVSAAEMMFLVVAELEEVEESAVVGLGAELGKVDWSKGVKDRRVVEAVGKVKKALEKL